MLPVPRYKSASHGGNTQGCDILCMKIWCFNRKKWVSYMYLHVENYSYCESSSKLSEEMHTYIPTYPLNQCLH